MLFLEGAVRPVVSFNPNWGKIFTGETLSLTCNVDSVGREVQEYIWYKDDKLLTTRSKQFIIKNAETHDSANYRCQTATSDRSDAVKLDVSYDWIILQVPHYVCEGDDVTLRCHNIQGHNANRTIFYNSDNNVIQDSESDLVSLKNVRLSMSGAYRCTKELSGGKYSTEAMLSVRDLFSQPQILVNPYAPKEGANVTLMCDTSVSMLRTSTELQFAFYRNGQNVQEFGLSNKYQIYSAQAGNSEDFTCEVKTSTSNVKKISRVTRFQILELFSFPQTKASPQDVTEGAEMTLTCDTIPQDVIDLKFAFYRDEEMVQGFNSSNKFQVQSAQLENSGNYTCEVRASNYNVKKRSRMLHIQVQELFSYPKIKLIYDLLVEGGNLTLSCDSNSTLLGNTTELLFAFYRNEQNVQEFGLSNKYEVESAQVADSGVYNCKVITANNKVMKISKGLNVQIQGTINYTSNNIIRMTLSACILIITLCIFLHHMKNDVMKTYDD
ncbi:high affinity immunoglobulin gamma Fc receptor I-like [Pelobates fuscus]|uniref:high affinity immunoglobulin gamma Fc receptor I-like n=1 Tax=Pelobates fuscus TaxID=191477 RepID=UPI002FE4B7B9